MNKRAIAFESSGDAPDFERIKHGANGMLGPDVYRKIYECARASSGGNLVEIGAAHGAGTITLALALQRDGRQDRIFSFERIIGGSREAYGGIAENRQILEGNLRNFGVDGLIDMIFDDVQASHTRAEGPFGLLLIDADGAIDRDFRLFYNQLVPGAPIIIDDCEERVKIKRLGRRRVAVDLKHLLTNYLVRDFLERGLLEQDTIIRGTFFGSKPLAITEPVDFDIDFAAVYRKLVFSEGVIPGRLRPFVNRHPALLRALRRARRVLRAAGLSK